jgi:transposase
MEVVTIGLDISKHVFHVHAVETQGQVTSRQRLRCGRSFPSFCTLSSCLVGIEACATAHYWAREIPRFRHG